MKVLKCKNTGTVAFRWAGKKRKAYSFKDFGWWHIFCKVPSIHHHNQYLIDFELCFELYFTGFHSEIIHIFIHTPNI